MPPKKIVKSIRTYYYNIMNDFSQEQFNSIKKIQRISIFFMHEKMMYLFNLTANRKK